MRSANIKKGGRYVFIGRLGNDDLRYLDIVEVIDTSRDHRPVQAGYPHYDKTDRKVVDQPKGGHMVALPVERNGRGFAVEKQPVAVRPRDLLTVEQVKQNQVQAATDTDRLQARNEAAGALRERLTVLLPDHGTLNVRYANDNDGWLFVGIDADDLESLLRLAEQTALG